MVELDFLATLSRIDLSEALDRLIAAGLDPCPGGGAEIFAPEIRQQICDHKTDGSRWLEVAREVHQRGIKSNCTMLYGHVESSGPQRGPPVACASCRTRPAGSRSSSRWRSTPRTAATRSPSPRPGVDWTCKTIATRV